MRFMVIVKATEASEGGVMPDTRLLTEMGTFNERLANAGVMLEGAGLQASAKGARVRFSGGKTTVVDGPFAETKELIAGYWIWKVASRQEAIDWVRQAPFGEGDVIEIRQIAEADDFGEEFTPELRAQEARIEKQIRGGGKQ